MSRQDRPDPRLDDLELVVRGRSFTGWESLTVVRSLDSISGEFELEVSDRLPFPVRAGDRCEVLVAGVLLVAGHVDQVTLAGDDSARKARVAGRDATCDLVDCSEMSDPGQWFDVRLEDLVREVCAPFSLEVESHLGDDDEPMEFFKVNPGETAFAALERAARRRGALLYSTGDGVVVLALPAAGRADVDLVEGERGNVKSYELRIDRRSRFSDYFVRGQAPGLDEWNGVDAAEVEGHATDSRVGRHRPLLVLGESSMTGDDAQKRSEWEAAVRAARAASLEVVVQGWRQQPGGRLWTVNEVVRASVPSAQVRQELLVAGVSHRRDGSSGATTNLLLTRRDAYRPQPFVDPDEASLQELLGTPDVVDELDGQVGE